MLTWRKDYVLPHLPTIVDAREVELGWHALVTVTAEGSFLDDRGRPLTVKALEGYLKRYADRRREMDTPALYSSATLVILADRDARWEAVFDVLKHCTEDSVRLKNVLFATEGPTELPHRFGIVADVRALHPWKVREVLPEHSVRIRGGGGRMALAGLVWNGLQGFSEDLQVSGVRLILSRRLRFGVVLHVLELVGSSGAEQVVLDLDNEEERVPSEGWDVIVDGRKMEARREVRRPHVEGTKQRALPLRILVR